MCNFVISSCSSIEISTNSHDMVHFMAKWNHFYNLPAVFLNIIPKLDMLKKKSFFVPVLCFYRHSNDYA